MAVVITEQLARYLRATRLRDIDLPVSSNAAKRMRRDIGLRWSWDDWWRAREDDLRMMTLEAFASKHKCSIGAASQRRSAL